MCQIKVKTAGIVGIVFAALAAVFASVGLATIWELHTVTMTTIPPRTTETSFSLWKSCLKIYTEESLTSGLSVYVVTNVTTDTCFDIVEVGSETRLEFTSIIRILIFASIGLLPVAMVIALVRHFALKPWLHQTLQAVLSFLIALMCFLSGSLQCASFSLYKEAIIQDGSKGQVALYSTLVAWLLAWVSMMFFLFGHICCETRINN